MRVQRAGPPMDDQVWAAVAASHLRGLPREVIAELLDGAERVGAAAGETMHRAGEDKRHRAGAVARRGPPADEPVKHKSLTRVGPRRTAAHMNDCVVVGAGPAGLAASARTVVVATGGENVPRTPRLAGLLPADVLQLHAAAYRRPVLLPAGPFLVVGSAQSGYQIAEELLATGRRVVLATSPAGRAPALHRGRETVEWLAESEFFDQRPQDLPDPSVLHAPQPLLAPGGRSASLQALVRRGAILTGRLVAVDGRRLRFDDSTAANIASADAFATRIRALLDEHIRSRGGARLAPQARPLARPARRRPAQR
ncbi:hypothetical protein [Pseudonocardia aurantiaca]|uniref:FAD/NAD(P)-binding domain-containing protein n=1 Tax=Pseudonocardia aurantiaca TaxID=75290 RepID=A0ABW4FMJ2_9PSEU